jgi:hypothetical protein
MIGLAGLLNRPKEGARRGISDGTPQKLFALPTNTGWDMTADGKRFLLTLSSGQGQGALTPIIVVLNWQADLTK